jgi:DNA-directed RNA polymerase
MDTLPLSRKLTNARFARRNRLKAKDRKRGRVYCGTPLGTKVTAELFLGPLATFISGELEEKPPSPPGDLGALAYQLKSETLALIALAPLLDSIIRGWEGRDGKSAEMTLCKKMGEYLRDRLALEKLLTSDIPGDRVAAKKVRKERKSAWKYLKSDWTSKECVAAGFWLMQCALSLEYFTYDEDDFPAIATEWQTDLDQIREELLRREPVLLPHTNLPPDWTGWLAQYDERLQATFVRDWHPETRKSINAAFRDPYFEHARGVNALQRVPFRIDDQLLALVDRFAVEVMNRAGKQRDADGRLVSDDVKVANILTGHPFYLTYNCDTRGRVYPIPHFNYGREDHVRALFKFANGMSLEPEDLRWLEVHCANCEGSTDKGSWDAHTKWVAENRDKIQKIAADPNGTFDLWRTADKPFRYVAACLELGAAWADPTSFVTHLPIAFDGTCNGIQHLALISRDADAGRLVNLTNFGIPHDVYRNGEAHKLVTLYNSDIRQDVYSDVITHVRTSLQADSDKWASWWRYRLSLLKPKQIRKLLKTPAMTFAYSATLSGMANQINEVYREISSGDEPPHAARFYLAKKIAEAAKELLPGPARVMRYIRDLAKHCALENRSLEWKSPTGFPVCNRYQEPNTTIVYLVANGIEVRYRVADGYLPAVNKPKAMNAAAPNFVHSLDAAHLIRAVNAATSDGITDFATVHDSFACLAPQAKRFNQIIRKELALMYSCYDALALLRDHNVSDADILPIPACGELDPLQVQHAEYPWS